MLRALAQGYDKTYLAAAKFSLKFSIIGVVVLCAAGSYYYFCQDKYFGRILLLSILCFPFFSVLNIWEHALKGKARFRLSACLTLIKVTFQLVYVFVITYSTNSLLLFWVCDTGAAFNIVCFLYVKQKIMVTIVWTRVEKPELHDDFSGSVIGHFGKADILIMGIFINPSTVAAYTIIMKINDFLYGNKEYFLAFLPEFYIKR